MKKVLNVLKMASDVIGSLMILTVLMSSFIIMAVGIFIGLLVIVPIIAVRWVIEFDEPLTDAITSAFGACLSLIKNGIDTFVKRLES